MAWSGAASTSKALEVPAALAACQGLSEGVLVRVNALPRTPIASRVSVEPASVNDWEQVELNAEFMEEQLLNQVVFPTHLSCNSRSGVVHAAVSPGCRASFVVISLVSEVPRQDIEPTAGCALILVPRSS